MILKGSQRSGGRQLAAHLLNLAENDHVTLHELRGFVAEDLRGALAEAYAVSLGTKCKQYMFSLSLNPPKEEECGVERLLEAADRAEAALGLTGQPRAIVLHEKLGRRHMHVVWSRIDPAEMKAVHLPFFKTRLAGLSKELYLENGWQLPEGHRENEWKNPLNFTLAEWQQAKRVGLDPREVKLLFREAWQASDGQRSFKAALEDRGYYLARGDRRGFVAVDLNGEVLSVARALGIKTKELGAKLGTSDALPSVPDTKETIQQQLSYQLRTKLHEMRVAQRQTEEAAGVKRTDLLVAQRAERKMLREALEKRRVLEAQQRQQRIRHGLSGLMDWITGRTARVHRQCELEALDGYRRDTEQSEALIAAQFVEREAIVAELREMKLQHRAERMQLARHVVRMLQGRVDAPVLSESGIRPKQQGLQGCTVKAADMLIDASRSSSASAVGSGLDDLREAKRAEWRRKLQREKEQSRGMPRLH